MQSWLKFGVEQGAWHVACCIGAQRFLPVERCGQWNFYFGIIYNISGRQEQRLSLEHFEHRRESTGKSDLDVQIKFTSIMVPSEGSTRDARLATKLFCKQSSGILALFPFGGMLCTSCYV